jgi:glycosyltransferase involved in cell wall biosynthesis
LNSTIPRVRPEGSTLSVVVPVYYNVESLPLLFGELGRFEGKLGELGMKLELIFVDDGSGDGSFEALMQFRQQRLGTKVIKLSRNFGAPAAVKAAMRFVTGDCFLFIAADLQDPVDQGLLMVEHWLAGEKFVISARTSRDDPATTRFFAALYYQLIKVTLVDNYPRGGIGLMLLDKAMLSFLVDSAQNINPNLYAFWLGFHPKILTYERAKRLHGRSRWTFWRKFRYFIDTFTGFSLVPIRAMSVLGLLMALLSFGYSVTVFFSALKGTVAVTGFAALAILTSFLGGCILFMLGVIGEYLWRIFVQVSGRPESVIEEQHL